MLSDKNTYTFLVVEDNAGDFMLIDDLLKEQFTEATITNATTFKQASTLIKATVKPYDAILLDLSLPDKSGDELITDTLKIADLTPIIVLTGNSNIDYSINAISLGVSDYLVKDELTIKILHKSILYAINRKLILENLRASEVKYRSLFETIPVGIYKSSPEGKFIDVNTAMINMFGYSSREEMLEIDIKTDLYFAESEREFVITQNDTDESKIFRLRKKNGDQIWVEDSGVYIKDETGNVLYHKGVLHDVTKRKLAEENLVQSEARLNEAQATAHLSNWEIDLVQDSIKWSDELYNILEIQKENVIPSIDLFFSFIHPDDVGIVRKNVSETRGNFNDTSSECRLLIKDGSIKYVFLQRKIELDNNKKPIRLYGILQDITERKIAEKKLEQQNKELLKTNSELDQFVYSTSHDLRAPLTSVIGLIDLLETESLSENTTGLLDLMKSCLTKADDTIKEIIDYSRNSRFEIRNEKIDTEKLITEIFESIALFDLNKQINKKITVNQSADFYTDKLRLKIMLNNIMFNAVKYSKPDSNIASIKVEVDISPARAVIIITDNGIGIKQEQIAKVFEMFHRATELSTGSGLGLYITKESIEKLNGTIDLQSEFGTGTVFTLNIPNLINT